MSLLNEEMRLQYEKLGCVAHIMASNSSHRSQKIYGLAVWIEPAIVHDQIEIFFRNGEPVGYFVWACLTPTVVSKIIKQNHVIHPSEWNEGDLLWVIDVLLPRDSLSIYRNKIRAILSQYSDNFYWIRKRKGSGATILKKRLTSGISAVIENLDFDK
jgi:cytolysin-activating lysine-acyltransferase